MQREAPLSENYLLFGSDSSEETDDDQSQGDDLSQDHPEDPEETENLNDDDCLTGVTRQTEQIHLSEFTWSPMPHRNLVQRARKPPL